MNKLALINVRVESRQRIPIGLLTLAACVKDRCEVRIFDPDPEDGDIKGLEEFGPDAIGIGFMTQTRGRAGNLLDIARRKAPGARVILGGVGPSVEPQSTYEQFRPDAVVVGEGEKALIAMARGGEWEKIPGVYMPGNEFRPGEIFERLDDIPLPAYECMPDISKYFCPPGGIRGKWFNRGTPMIMTGRGCPYRCTFCSSRLMFGRKVRRRSVDSVLSEIRLLREKFAVDAVYFYDDTFNAPPSWVFEFCEKISNEPYKLTWCCQARVNLMTEELGRAMKRAGCVQADIGVESGSPKVLRAICKDETVDDIISAFDICHKVGIAPMGNFLVGCPEETREDVELTKQLLRRIKPSFSEFYFLIPYPGSPLYRQAIENGWLVDRSYEGRGMVDRPVMEINFTRDQQIAIRREYYRMTAFANIRGYLAPGVLFSAAKSLRPSMIAAFFREFARTRNIRDEMQAFAHALRKYYAERQEPQAPD